MKYEPWVAEPMGQHFAYMTGISRNDRTSWQGFQWPERGYVECHSWEGEDLKIPRVLGGFGLRGGGLYGFMDGRGFYRYGLAGYDNHKQRCSIQLCVIDRREAIISRGETRVPRAWVKCSGVLSEIEDYLYQEGTEYAEYVRQNLINGYKAGQKSATFREAYEIFWGVSPKW